MAGHTRTSRVDLYAAIRRDAKAGLTKRALQRKHGIGYRTVAAALQSAWPKQPKPPPKRGSRLDAYRDVIDGWLRDDLDAPRKKRHPAKRIFDRLLDEHDTGGVVSYGMARDYAATRRREIRVDDGREPATTFIPQTHLPGREAEADFGEVVVRLRGELVTCTLFSLRLSYSGKAVHRIAASRDRATGSPHVDVHADRDGPQGAERDPGAVVAAQPVIAGFLRPG
ncbi:hypothetical protein [Nonomuraea deserti]|uniref:hypothetical protein n=1 Tax=Nonomuraea deserti TaxID=1848322 RepID=UPI001C7096C1|nr:hypothetical protein [Nonomuraea deserti]